MKIFSAKPLQSPKVALVVEYQGAAYSGWQIQHNPPVPTVQGVLEKALSTVANAPVKTYCAGRTDAGVHATAQVVHFETPALRSEKAWVCGVNANLPDDVVVRAAVGVDADFHARFSATARTYRYIIANQPVRSAVLSSAVTLVKEPLDAAKMHEAAQYLLGERDFSAYRGAGCQSNSPFRFVEYINVSRQGDLVVAEICANAFLLHMVRNIMGVLIDIGLGLQPPVWAQQVLESRDRKQAGRTAPAAGLYLVHARYPGQAGLPQAPVGPLLLGGCC